MKQINRIFDKFIKVCLDFGDLRNYSDFSEKIREDFEKSA